VTRRSGIVGVVDDRRGCQREGGGSRPSIVAVTGVASGSMDEGLGSSCHVRGAWDPHAPGGAASSARDCEPDCDCHRVPFIYYLEVAMLPNPVRGIIWLYLAMYLDKTI
jgi:hypothetical protein